MQKEILKYEKIKYKKGIKNLDDMSDFVEIYEIKKDIVKCCLYNIGKAKKLLSRNYYKLDSNIINLFIKEVLQIVSEPKWNGVVIDDCYSNLEITFIDNSLKINADRTLNDGNKSIEVLFKKLMSTAKEIEKK